MCVCGQPRGCGRGRGRGGGCGRPHNRPVPALSAAEAEDLPPCNLPLPNMAPCHGRSSTHVGGTHPRTNGDQIPEEMVWPK